MKALPSDWPWKSACKICHAISCQRTQRQVSMLRTWLWRQCQVPAACNPCILRSASVAVASKSTWDASKVGSGLSHRGDSNSLTTSAFKAYVRGLAQYILRSACISHTSGATIARQRSFTHSTVQEQGGSTAPHQIHHARMSPCWMMKPLNSRAKPCRCVYSSIKPNLLPITQHAVRRCVGTTYNVDEGHDVGQHHSPEDSSNAPAR